MFILDILYSVVCNIQCITMIKIRDFFLSKPNVIGDLGQKPTRIQTLSWELTWLYIVHVKVTQMLVCMDIQFMFLWMFDG